MSPTLRWDCYAAVIAGLVLAGLGVGLGWPSPDTGYLPPFREFWSGLTFPGELADSTLGPTVTKFVTCWIVYALFVFVPFRIESQVPAWPGASGRPRVRDSRVLRTSVPMLTLATAFYCWCRFREKPGGMDAGLGDLIVTSWLGPLIVAGAFAALAALVLAALALAVRPRSPK